MIHINGETENIQEMTIINLLEHKQVESPDMVAVQINGEIIERENFETTIVKDGDSVEFLYFMGGGTQLL